MLHQDILHATAHFRTNHESAMTGKYRTAVNHNVLAWDTTTATIRILTALDADAIVTGIKL